MILHRDHLIFELTKKIYPLIMVVLHMIFPRVIPFYYLILHFLLRLIQLFFLF